MSSYNEDFYGWSLEQAAMLRQHDFSNLDIENLIEELEAMSARERRELLNRLRVLFVHLLKWQYQPQRRGNSWRLTIETQTEDVLDILEMSPALRRFLPEISVKAYNYARKRAAQETGLALETFPVVIPFTIEQALSGTFFPE